MSKYLIIALFLPFAGFGQTNSGMVWTEFGVKGSVTKKVDWAADLTTRFGSLGVNSFFPQVSVKYKLTKWFRPSLEYRAIFNHLENGNYNFSNRLNINGEFKHGISDVTFGFRIRYQYSFGTLFSGGSYDPEFDQAIRIKPSVTYDVKNSMLSPTGSVEFFYDPAFGQYGRRFTKIRTFVGVKSDWKKPFDISVGYMFDGKINLPNPSNRHILSISMAYKLGED
jgi:hypothetical protein